MPLITISYSIGSDGLSIARKLSQELSVELFDDARLQEEVSRLGISSEEIRSLDEKQPGFFDRLLSRKPDIYLELMQSVIYDFANRGEGVIVGHGSQTLLRDFDCALHVLIHNREGSRVEKLMEKQGLSREAAIKVMRKSDDTQRGFFRYAFQLEWDDPELYDMVLNTEKIGSETVVQLILDASRAEKMKACSLAATETMKRLALAGKIKAELMKNDIYLHNISIEIMEGNVVEITGVTLSAERKERTMRVVQNVPGVTDVKMSVFTRSASW
jgi:cytidylate kinase